MTKATAATAAAATTAAVNYTAEMVQQLHDAAPLNLEKAKALGLTMGRSYRSIIAKAKREEIAYEVKAPVAKKKPTVKTKVETVAIIATALNVDTLAGLEKATGAALNDLLDAIIMLSDETSEDESETSEDESETSEDESETSEDESETSEVDSEASEALNEDDEALQTLVDSLTL
jgi:DNA repair exonuclease SbcCD nuclease subunit